MNTPPGDLPGADDLPNPLIDILRQEIKQKGAISFAEFMSRCLYQPHLGYYEQPHRPIGRHGDFYTSISTGPLFGEMLSHQLLAWLKWLPPSPPASPHPPPKSTSAPLALVEAGAHDGQLAYDILNGSLLQSSEFGHLLRYVILEPSSRRQTWQRQKLLPFNPMISWCTDWDHLPSPRISGVIFSNELLDALPPHRLGWDAQARKWFEWGVNWQNQRFTWICLPLRPQVPTPQWWPDHDQPPAPWPANLLSVLPDGFTTEVNPTAESWWRTAAQHINTGILMTFDYGLEQEDLFSPYRPHGTLQAYSRHLINPDLLSQVGQQDLTAQVNFSALKAIGESEGLRTIFFGTQSEFFSGLLGRLGPQVLGLGPDQPQRLRQFQSLIHPDHLGQTMKVLVQEARSKIG